MRFRLLLSHACSTLLLASASLVGLVGFGCSSSSSDTTPTDSGPADAVSDAPSTCSVPGKLTEGAKDSHCGTTTQVTSAASCHPTDDDAGPADVGADASSDAVADVGGDAAELCPYGDTVFGGEADDDDCKYHVKWTLGTICQGSGGVPLTVVVTTKSDGKPAVGAATDIETFTSTTTGTCDNASTHAGPNTGLTLAESAGGTYSGKLVFDKTGAWTVRLHFFESCSDTEEDSPHGHIAFHVTVP